MDGPFKSQLEAAEHATEAEERRRGPRATYRWATQPIRDGVHEIRLAYERSPNWTKAVVILAVIGFAVALPSLLPYITARITTAFVQFGDQDRDGRAPGAGAERRSRLRRPA